MLDRRRYPARYLSYDLIAGATLWAVFAAQALAYSRLAHATATAGLVTAIAGAVIYALLGSSGRISIGPAGGIAAIVGAAVAGVPAANLPLSLAILTIATGVFLCLAGVFNLTFLERLFPAPVFVGYLAGTGVTILVGQGKDIVAGNTLSLAIGLAAILLVLALKRLVPRLPAPFAVLAAATIASVVFDLHGRGVPVLGSSLGSFALPALPEHLGWDEIRAMIAPALGLALIVYVDAIANADMLAAPDTQPVRPRREFFALGASSLVAGILGGFVPGTSSSRSIVGIRAGEKSALAGAFAGVLLLLTALSVVRFLQPMPLPALSGVVFAAAIDLIDWRRLREMYRLRPADFGIGMVAAVGVVVVGMVDGIAIGIAAALAEAVRRGMYPYRSLVSGKIANRYYGPFERDLIREARGVLVYRFGGALFFGNAQVFLDDMRQIARLADPSLHTVVINADGLGIPDATARDCLVAARKALEQRSIAFQLGNARMATRTAIEKIGGFTMIDEDAFLAAVREARANHHESRSDTSST